MIPTINCITSQIMETKSSILAISAFVQVEYHSGIAKYPKTEGAYKNGIKI